MMGSTFSEIRVYLKCFYVALLLVSISPSAFTADSVIAHRGVHQNYHRVDLKQNTCTAERIYPITQGYLENTLASMREAFRLGADWVEIDIHPTTDGKFAIFHDWALECRTNGKGVTRAQSMNYLKTLDIAYGYTADGGETFPLRGKGIGLMPTLTEVLDAFPQKQFLINFKSRDVEEATALANFLTSRSPEQNKLLMVYGRSAEMLQRFSTESNVVAWVSKDEIRKCYAKIMSSEGTDLGACAGRVFGGPLDLAQKMPGWPAEFIARVQSQGGQFYVMGIDSKEAILKLGNDYTGGIWTDYIEVVGPLL